MVFEIRKKQPMIGVRKLQKQINKKRKQTHISVGRDQLYDILRKHGLLIARKHNYVKTTQSYHRFRVYKNLIKELEITRADQVYVSDITYITTLDGFCYLSLITDLFSRKIVGYCLSQSLSIEGCLKALKMALKSAEHPEKLIHHSDRGIQYCSHAYVELLQDNQVKISMTEDKHVYENAVAERINGILKTEFLLGETLRSFTVAKQLVAEAVKIYNNERLHLSLNYETPNDVYNASKQLQKNELLVKNLVSNNLLSSNHSHVDNSEVINTQSTSYPHKNTGYRHISECFKLLK
jgi:transposase InsO family protein